MGYLIVNADDFGYSRGINYGIIDSYRHGIVTSATIMSNMPGFSHAIRLAKENPDLGIGVHLNITEGKPVLEDKSSLINADGNFFNRDEIQKRVDQIDLEDVYREWKAQIDKVKRTGIQITHLDSHHYLHEIDVFRKVAIVLAIEEAIPVRQHLDEEFYQIRHPDFSYSANDLADEGNPLQTKEIRDEIYARLQTDAVVELLTHPGYIDYFTSRKDSLGSIRTQTVEFLCRSEFKEKILRLPNVHLVSYELLS